MNTNRYGLLAGAHFRDGYNCAESVLKALARSFADREVDSAVATGFGAGVGRSGSLCGALLGGVMAIGLRAGRQRPDDKETMEQVHALVGEFQAAFEREFGSRYCKELTGYNLADPEEREKFHSDPGRRERCGAFVVWAASWLHDRFGKVG